MQSGCLISIGISSQFTDVRVGHTLACDVRRQVAEKREKDAVGENGGNCSVRLFLLIDSGRHQQSDDGCLYVLCVAVLRWPTVRAAETHSNVSCRPKSIKLQIPNKQK